jgi:cell division protein FtsL
LRRLRRLRLATAVLVAFVIALLFAAVGMHVVLAQNQFRLDSLNSQASAQQAQYQQLRLQVDQLSAPSRILGVAQGSLGMVPPSSVNYVTPASATSGHAASAATTQGGPPPATAPAGWSTIKAHLAAGS